MTLNISLIKDRCYFKPFNVENDKNLKTGRAGLKYCHHQCLGAIFNLLGLTFSMKGKLDGKKFTLYIYKNSLKAWLDRHASDPIYVKVKEICRVINARESNENYKISNIDKSLIKKYILDVVHNYENNLKILATRDINPGKLLSIRQIMEKAENEFNFNPDKNEILIAIQNELNDEYVHGIKKRVAPYFYDASKIYKYSFIDFGIKGRFEESCIYKIALKFLISLPGVDKTKYRGYHLK